MQGFEFLLKEIVLLLPPPPPSPLLLLHSISGCTRDILHVRSSQHCSPHSLQFTAPFAKAPAVLTIAMSRLGTFVPFDYGTADGTSTSLHPSQRLLLPNTNTSKIPWCRHIYAERRGVAKRRTDVHQHRSFTARSATQCSATWKAGSFQASPDFPRIFSSSKVPRLVYNSPPLFRILRQINPVHSLTANSFKIHVNG